MEFDSRNAQKISTMKTMNLLSLSVLLVVFLSTTVCYAQKVGVAADKQKQENLEKNKKRQAELKKKYNSLTPEQAAEAERRANEYKKSGGKQNPSGSSTKPATGNNKPAGTTVSKGKQAPKQGNVKKPVARKEPVWMDAKGNPKKVTTGKTTTKQEVKPVTTKEAEKKVAPKPAPKPKVATEQKAAGTKK